MKFVIRVDVDNAYDYTRNFFTKVANYLTDNYWFPKLEKLHYLYHLVKFLDYLSELGIKSSFFFKTSTIPTIKILQKIKHNNHEIGLHLVQSYSYNSFIRELEIIKKTAGKEIYGFTKHGQGEKKLSRKHYHYYEPDKYIDWALRSGLLYFSGNKLFSNECKKDFSIKKDIKTGKKAVFIECVQYVEYWMWRVDPINEFEKFLEHDIVVFLIHPLNWYINKRVRKDFDKLISLLEKVGSPILLKDFALSVLK